MSVDYVISTCLLVEWLCFKMHCKSVKWLFYATTDIRDSYLGASTCCFNLCFESISWRLVVDWCFKYYNHNNVMIVGIPSLEIYFPHCLVKQVGAGSRGRAGKTLYVLWAMIWSRHIEGIHASQDSLQHTNVGNCASWTFPGRKSCI